MRLQRCTTNLQNQTLEFIKNCHEAIGKSIIMQDKDSDLVDITTSYEGENQGFWCLFNESQEIIGTVGVRGLMDKDITYAEARRLYILPTEQGKGYGAVLLDYAIYFACSHGYKKIRGTTSFDRELAIKMMEKRGYYQIPKYRISSADLFYELSLDNAYEDEYTQITQSLKEEEITFQQSLILNPVENVPKADILMPATSFIHGIYNTDSLRTPDQKIETKIQFSGRQQIAEDINTIYKLWSDLLGGDSVTMRLFSGLHAHIILFMSITEIGDCILLLPEKAGGHMATKAILERLGLRVEEFVVDTTNMKIDIEESLKLIDKCKPKIIFVDRSEGLLYEDFSWLQSIHTAYKVFDASQYLTNIICKDYPNPFDWGFDMILSTLHKNLPGPQRALICSKHLDDMWFKLRKNISTYVSNMHSFSIYSAGLLLHEYNSLKILSRTMLENAILLEQELQRLEVPVIRRSIRGGALPTHHIWISVPDKNRAFQVFSNMERIGIMTNYRQLPYDLGYGLRLGLSAATYSGLTILDIPELANLIHNVYINGYTDECKKYSQALIAKIKEKGLR